jgi:hypothetical protein
VITAGAPCLIGGLFAAINHFIGTQKATKIINTLKTKTNLIRRLNDCGVYVTDDEPDTLIRAAYQTVKSDFAAQVSKEVAG